MPLRTNIVSQERLRAAQLEALKVMADSLSLSFGPMGSNTLILHDGQQNKYSKDGFTLLKEIKFLGTIEEATKQDMEDMLRDMVKEVGDNTTSVTILAYLIFKELMENEMIKDQAPYKKIEYFKKAVKLISKRIMSRAQVCTLDDIYHITYTATNGNKMLADHMRTLYDKYGMDVYIDITTSNTEDFIVKELDGLTLEAGYMDPCFINFKADNACHIRNAKIYYFEDPIDTSEMGAFFDTIIGRNIIQPMQNGEAPTPTVILCPKISRDYSVTIQQIVEFMYHNDINNRPPLLVVTNIYDKAILTDITLLCDCKVIKKYIDSKNQDADVAKGLAPDLVTITEFCGHAEEVVSDMGHTKFINPVKMRNKDGSVGEAYTALIEFLEHEIIRQKESGSQGTQEVALLKRRLNALKANTILLYVGGISPAERDSFKDLLEDAVLNCRSAAKHGFGYGANFEAFLAVRAEIEMQTGADFTTPALANPGDEFLYLQIIEAAYRKVIIQLYKTVYTDDAAEQYLSYSIKEKMPVNLRNGAFDGSVLTTIKSDVHTLNVLSRLLTIMYTCNQAMLQNPVVNTYEG